MAACARSAGGTAPAPTGSSSRAQLIGFTNALWTGAELLGHEQHEEFIRARVKLADGMKLNDVLHAILPQVEVHGVQEEVPSMHDVFIRAVGENAAAVAKPELTE